MYHSRLDPSDPPYICLRRRLSSKPCQIITLSAHLVVQIRPRIYGYAAGMALWLIHIRQSLRPRVSQPKYARSRDLSPLLHRPRPCQQEDGIPSISCLVCCPSCQPSGSVSTALCYRQTNLRLLSTLNRFGWFMQVHLLTAGQQRS